MGSRFNLSGFSLGRLRLWLSFNRSLSFCYCGFWLCGFRLRRRLRFGGLGVSAVGGGFLLGRLSLPISFPGSLPGGELLGPHLPPSIPALLQLLLGQFLSLPLLLGRCLDGLAEIRGEGSIGLVAGEAEAALQALGVVVHLVSQGQTQVHLPELVDEDDKLAFHLGLVEGLGPSPTLLLEPTLLSSRLRISRPGRRPIPSSTIFNNLLSRSRSRSNFHSRFSLAHS